MPAREGQSLRVAVVARSIYPLHRFGGLERHVYDLVRCLLSRDVHVTLIAPPASIDRPTDAAADAVFRHPNLTLTACALRDVPVRQQARHDDPRSQHGISAVRASRRAGRGATRQGRRHRHRSRAWRQRARLRDGRTWIADARAPLVFNPQGMEEFGATDPSRAPLKRLGYRPLRVAVRRAARAADRVIATDRSLVAPGVDTSRRQQRCRSRHPQRD